MSHQTKWLMKSVVLTLQSGRPWGNQSDRCVLNHKMVKYNAESLIPQPMSLHLKWLRVIFLVCKSNPMAAL